MHTYKYTHTRTRTHTHTHTHTHTYICIYIYIYIYGVPKNIYTLKIIVNMCDYIPWRCQQGLNQRSFLQLTDSKQFRVCMNGKNSLS